LGIGGGLLAAAAAIWLGFRPNAQATNQDRPLADRFVVHEWGTFTNFSGFDGGQLDFRPLEESDLPEFVHNRRTGWYRNSPERFLTKATVYARQRMETPVTYFYTDRPRDIRARVDFPAGLLTEYYPPVKSLGPAWNYQETKTNLSKSFLDWGQVRIIPQELFAKWTKPNAEGKAELMMGDFRHQLIGLQRPLTPTERFRLANSQQVPAAIPTVSGGDHYGAARETDSAVVEFIDQDKVAHFEKFLFYRGIGNFGLPLQFKPLGKDRFTVANYGSEPVGEFFLVQIREGQVRYQLFLGLAAHSDLFLELGPATQSVAELSEAMVQTLIRSRLYEKEARAMVKTWQGSWFGEEGTRLLYLVPEKQTNAVIPLSISPAPDELVRVLVGRMETLTPERADKLVEQIAAAGTCFDPTSDVIWSDLGKMGRFAESALVTMRSETRFAEYVPQIDALIVRAKAINGG